MSRSLSTTKVVLGIAVLVWTLWGVGMWDGDRWYVLETAWFMSVTMALGSFIAGSTCEGGGAVAFPVMTLLFDIAPVAARDFSLMIQSVGMTAAGLTIWLTGIPIAWRAVLPAILGGSVGMILGLEFVAPHVTALVAKLVFTSTWLAFGWSLWIMGRQRVGDPSSQLDAVPWVGIIFYSAIGGVVSALVGSGVDICVFSLLVLRYGLDEKVATPTSVFLMGIIAAVGFFWREALGPGVAAESWTWWWASVPVVVVGAPLGAWFIRTRSRTFLVRLILGSIVLQYLGALLILPMSTAHWGMSFAVIAIALMVFGSMYRLGRHHHPG